VADQRSQRNNGIHLIILETNRLSLRTISLDDAEFILRLLNEPSFLQNIGDKGVRTIADAWDYIRDGPQASYRRFGFGSWLVTLKATNAPIGMSGLLKREVLEDVDIGYALVPEAWSQGYAFEAATGISQYARETLRLKRIAAVVNVDNQSSIRLLEKLGFNYARMIRLEPNAAEIRMYLLDFDLHSRK